MNYKKHCPLWPVQGLYLENCNTVESVEIHKSAVSSCETGLSESIGDRHLCQRHEAQRRPNCCKPLCINARLCVVDAAVRTGTTECSNRGICCTGSVNQEKASENTADTKWISCQILCASSILLCCPCFKKYDSCKLHEGTILTWQNGGCEYKKKTNIVYPNIDKHEPYLPNQVNCSLQNYRINLGSEEYVLSFMKWCCAIWLKFDDVLEKHLKCYWTTWHYIPEEKTGIKLRGVTNLINITVRIIFPTLIY
jgi:hypothetical protein